MLHYFRKAASVRGRMASAHPQPVAGGAASLQPGAPGPRAVGAPKPRPLRRRPGAWPWKATSGRSEPNSRRAGCATTIGCSKNSTTVVTSRKGGHARDQHRDRVPRRSGHALVHAPLAPDAHARLARRARRHGDRRRRQRSRREDVRQDGAGGLRRVRQGPVPGPVPRRRRGQIGVLPAQPGRGRGAGRAPDLPRLARPADAVHHRGAAPPLPEPVGAPHARPHAGPLPGAHPDRLQRPEQPVRTVQAAAPRRLLGRVDADVEDACRRSPRMATA